MGGADGAGGSLQKKGGGVTLSVGGPRRQASQQGKGVLGCCMFVRKAPDTFNFLRHVMRATLSVRPKCSHRCVSLTETSLKPVQTLKHTTKNSAEQTAMRTKWFKHIAIKTVQAHLLVCCMHI